MLFLPVPTVAWSLEVVGVPDGDTILVLQQNRCVKISLYGIDAPERKQAFGKQAQKIIADIIIEKDVEIEEIAKITNDEIVALVRSDDMNLNEELIRSGCAWVDVESCERPVCRQWQSLEEEAKRDQRGLWQDKNPVPPWEWRKKNQNIIANFLKYIWMILPR